MTKQHYRMTLDDAISHYQCGLISATALLYYFLKIRLKETWKITLHQREITKKLGISRAQFYRGIQRLKEKQLIDWEAPNGLVVELTKPQISTNVLDKTATSEQNCNRVNKTATSEQNCNRVNKTATPVNKTATPVNKTATATPPKPLQNKGSSDPPNSYQIFIKSLSEGERENFLKFVEESIDKFDPPINDIEGWLAGKNKAQQNRWEVYYQKYQAQEENEQTQQRNKRPGKIDLKNHRKNQYQEWLAELEEMRTQAQNTYQYTENNSPELEERQVQAQNTRQCTENHSQGRQK